jgi:hypothetical protein
MTASVLATGRIDISTGGKNYGKATVAVRGMKNTDHVLLTPRVTRGAMAPESLGPLFCAFVEDIDTDRFLVLVYDIQGGAFNVTVPVEWVVTRP